MPTPEITLEQLGGFSPLNGLRKDSLAQVHGRIRAQNKAPGETLFTVGDRDDRAYFLLSGELEMVDDQGQVLRTIVSGTHDAHHRLAHQLPRKVTARAKTPVVCFDLDNQLLDVMLTWDQTGSFEVGELGPGHAGGGAEVADGDWMSALLQLELFQRLPPANLQALMMRMERVDVAAGETIVAQDAPGDYFYVISKGHAIVTRSSGALAKPVRLADLGPGACFGEEALIAETRRNATVQMRTPGEVLRLSKADFQANLGDKVTRYLSAEDAAKAVAAGSAKYLDVRLPSEFRAGSIADAQNIPLLMLRARLPSLDRGTTWICCCDSGRRSSVAAFILQQAGWTGAVLRGGIPSTSSPAATH